MVGYVYSFDFERGYNYILIEAYDADSLDFISETAECDLYSVNRSDGSYVFSKPRKLGSILSLRQIKSITALVSADEADDDYPRKISWEIIPGGNVNERSIEDVPDMHYVPTEVLDTSADYVNVTALCFDSSPSELEGSFCVYILRQVCSLCGIYADDTFAYFGKEIFCICDMAHYEKALFGTDILYEKFKGIIPMPKKRSKIRRADILKALLGSDLSPMSKGTGALSYMVETERYAAIAIAIILRDALEHRVGITELSEKLKPAIQISFEKLCMVHEEFAKATGCKTADMKYLTLTELHGIFAFAGKALDAPKLITKKRRRRAYQNKMPVPTVLYKGKLY